jgi:hypothetical protein
VEDIVMENNNIQISSQQLIINDEKYFDQLIAYCNEKRKEKLRGVIIQTRKIKELCGIDKLPWEGSDSNE